MRDNTTLGEVKARCEEMTGKYGDNCCDNCEYAELGCCDPPENWVLEEGKKLCAQPNWEEMFYKSEDTCRKMYMKLEDACDRADKLEAENMKLRHVILGIEFLLGRKLEV